MPTTPHLHDHGCLDTNQNKPGARTSWKVYSEEDCAENILVTSFIIYFYFCVSEIVQNCTLKLYGSCWNNMQFVVCDLFINALMQMPCVFSSLIFPETM